MKNFAVIALALCLSVPALASTHKYDYNVPCSVLWPAVKDTIRNSGKYGIIGIDSAEMTVSYNIGGNLTGKRINSLLLNTISSGCELQVQTAFTGLVNNDAGDVKKRIDESLVKLQAAQAAKPEIPVTSTAPGTPAAPSTPIPN